MFNRLHIVAFIQIVPMIACAAEPPQFDAQFLQAYTAEIQTIITSGNQFSPSSKQNNALTAYVDEKWWIGASQYHQVKSITDGRRFVFAHFWKGLSNDQKYQDALHEFRGSACQSGDRQVLMQTAATCTAGLLNPLVVNFDLTTSDNTPDDHRSFLRNNKGITDLAQEYMLAGSMMLCVVGREATKIMAAKATKVLTGEAKQ